MSNANNQVAYINNMLNEFYVHKATLRKTSLTEISIYCHCETSQKLLVQRSKNANDSVYRTLMPIAHPNLPQIYDVVSTEDELIILEEFIEGVPLSSLIKEHPLSKSQAKSFIRQLCYAVDTLHQYGIVHRDIKPDNILIDGQNLTLIDFHISRFFRENAEADTLLLGSIGYAPPEQFGLAQTTPASDIYAIGIVYNEMLVCNSPAVTLASGRAGRIIRHCTQMQAKDRYPNIKALLNAL